MGSTPASLYGLPEWTSLLPKLRDHYAEFLDHVSLVHLRLLASPTCVGLRYGRRVCSPESFSCLSTLRTLRLGCPALSWSRLGLRLHASTANPQSRSRFVPVSLSDSTHTDGTGISTRLPSATPLGPHLRLRLTLR